MYKDNNLEHELAGKTAPNAAREALGLPKFEEERQATQYITISVAEYHFLTKVAAMLEVILADNTYNQAIVVEATRKAMAEIKSEKESFLI